MTDESKWTVRRVFRRSGGDDQISVSLEDGERIVGTDSEGGDYWVYVARPVTKGGDASDG